MTTEELRGHITFLKRRMASTPDFESGISCNLNGNAFHIFNANYPETKAEITLQDNIVRAYSGSRKENKRLALNEMLNFPQGGFLKNTYYIIDDGAFLFLSDSEGRICRALATLSPNVRIVHGTPAKHPSDKDKRDSDEFGHIIAQSFMAPNERINIVDINSSINKDFMSHVESFLSASRRLGENYKLTVSADISYANALTVRPSAISYSAEICSLSATGSISVLLNNK